MTDNKAQNHPLLDEIKTTPDDLSSRSGIESFPTSLKQIGIFDWLYSKFEFIRKIDRRLMVREAFEQLICFL